MSDSLCAQTIMFAGYEDEAIEGYLSRPATDNKRAGLVVLHHRPGYDRATKECVRRLAEMGYDSLMPNLYWREAPGASPEEAAAVVIARGGVPDTRLIGDVGGALTYLRKLPTANGKVGVVGFCSGGRQAVLAACNLDLDAVVDCYGAFVVRTSPADFHTRVAGIADQLPTLRAPVLGLFGNEDQRPSPAEVDEFEELLKAYGKTYEFHRYDDTGHAFFSVDAPSYRVAAANDGWQRIEDFLGTHVAT